MKRDNLTLQNKMDEMEKHLAKINKLVADEFSILKIKTNEWMAGKKQAMKEGKVKK